MKLSICGLQTYVLFSYGADVKIALMLDLRTDFLLTCKLIA